VGKCRTLANFGWSLYAANFGHSGRADLAIGSPALYANEQPSYARIGKVNVIYGSRTGLTAAGNQQWNQNSPGIPGKTVAGDQFGYSAG
jgi:hypothetical protein